MNVTDVPAQIAPVGAAASVTLGVTLVVTVIVTPLLVAVVGEEQVKSLVITQVTTSPLAKLLDVNVLLVVLPPEFTPFTFHWYDGAAPVLTGVAVNVTLVPAHTEELLAVILTEGAAGVVTVIVSQSEGILVVQLFASVMLVMQ